MFNPVSHISDFVDLSQNMTSLTQTKWFLCLYQTISTALSQNKVSSLTYLWSIFTEMYITSIHPVVVFSFTNPWKEKSC